MSFSKCCEKRLVQFFSPTVLVRRKTSNLPHSSQPLSFFVPEYFLTNDVQAIWIGKRREICWKFVCESNKHVPSRGFYFKRTPRYRCGVIMCKCTFNGSCVFIVFIIGDAYLFFFFCVLSFKVEYGRCKSSTFFPRVD